MRGMQAYEYVDRFKSLISRERRAEEEFHRKEISSLSGVQRQRKGRALLGLVRQAAKGESSSVFRFVAKDASQLPFFEGSVGAQVLLSLGNPLEESLSGSIVGHSSFFVDVYVPTQSKLLFSDDVRLDLFVNDATYDAQLRVLDGFSSWSFELGRLREVLLGTTKPRLGKVEPVEYLDTSLNDSQRLAVRNALAEEEFFLIQGPPGTGKTKTAVEIVRQLVKRGLRVLVSADANMAVDNIMQGLLEFGVDAIRLGQSPKMLDAVREHTLERVIESGVQYRVVRDGLERVAQLRESQREELMPTRKNSAGLSYFQIKKLAERSQSDFGVSLQDLRSMSRWIDAQSRIKDIQSRIHKVKERIIADRLQAASVICSTNTSAGSTVLDKSSFDVVLIDEAGQSTEVSCLIPLSKAKKVILVGDHMQLPPTVLSQDAQELSVSLFERMVPLCRYCLLDTQYRMFPLINEFPSQQFYGGLLNSDFSTNSHVLVRSPFEKNVVFIPCLGVESRHKGGTSWFNDAESDVVFDLVRKYQSLGVDADAIGVISPYLEQVKRLSDRLPLVEVRSVDGFQGRQKEVIIISLVRSNKRGDLGFLKDYRRLNVALTRAQKELVIIGNPDTIRKDEVYASFLSFVQKKGVVYKHNL